MSTELVLALLFGTPVLALALAVAYHAQLYLMDRRGSFPAARSEEHATEQYGPQAEFVLDLRRSIEELQDQLARQRHSLSGLLSETAQRDSRRELGEPPRAATPRGAATPSSATPSAAPPSAVPLGPVPLSAAPLGPVPLSAVPSSLAPEAIPTGRELPAAVRQLAAEGLSDRAIARRLRIGLEEVRLLSQRSPARHPEPAA